MWEKVRPGKKIVRTKLNMGRTNIRASAAGAKVGGVYTAKAPGVKGKTIVKRGKKRSN